MSLVAVVKRAGDRAGELPETRVVPVGMPQDVRFGSYFGAGTPCGFTMMAPMAAPAPAPAAGRGFRLGAALQRMITRVRLPREVEAEVSDDPLVELASELEPDGGMPGESDSARAARSVAAVLAFVAAGHTLTVGAFRTHVARLVAFLKSVGGVSDRERALIERAIEAASSGSAPDGDWLALARGSGAQWKRIEKALKT
jgi:hypothetical protein